MQFGLTASLNHPGGNLTGVVIFFFFGGKELRFCMNCCPMLPSSQCWSIRPTRFCRAPIRATQDAARSLGVQLHILRASTAGEIDAVFASLVKLRARALVVGDDPYFLDQRAQVLALAARHAVPTISGWREFPVAGGLMSYGGDRADAYRQVGL